MIGDKLYAGTQSRGIITIENGEAKEVVSKPRSYFINALANDGEGHLWAGAQARGENSGLFDSNDLLKPNKASVPTGTVTAIVRGNGDDMWIATDGRGAFHLQNGKLIEKFTFEGTGGALRSDHISGIFVDAEEVVWFATDKGVCRYDPNAMRAEAVSEEANGNYVRALLRTSRGHLLAGTNAGLYVNDGSKKWAMIPGIGRRIVYALAEDNNGRALIATASGFFVSPSGSDSTFTRLPASCDQDNIRAIATVAGATYIATYGYGVERLQGSQRTLVWPEASADNHLREITSLGKDANDRLLIGTATAGVFFFDGKQTTIDNAFEKLRGDAVWSMLADGSEVWIASAKGLFVFRAGELQDIAPGVNARRLSVSAGIAHAEHVWFATVGI